MVCDVAGDLSAAHRESDQRDVDQIEFAEQCVKIGSEGVVVETGARLAGSPEPASVISDDPVARPLQNSADLLQDASDAGQPCTRTTGLPIPALSVK